MEETYDTKFMKSIPCKEKSKILKNFPTIQKLCSDLCSAYGVGCESKFIKALLLGGYTTKCCFIVLSQVNEYALTVNLFY